MKKSFLLLSLWAVSAILFAHEFWILPQKWFTEVGQPVLVQVRVGENFTGEPWEAGVSRVIRFFTVLKKTETNRLETLQKSGLDSLMVRFDQPGTHLVALATNSKFIELEAAKFDAYLQEDGLEHVRRLRSQAGKSNQPGRELYRREAASLVQVGGSPTAVFFEKTGFELQILPQQNPLLADPESEMTFQIRFRGKPLPNALVRHWHKSADGNAAVQFQTADRRGRVRFRLNAGEQMVSIVHMVPHPEAAEADWQSIWGNLTFCLR